VFAFRVGGLGWLLMRETFGVDLDFQEVDDTELLDDGLRPLTLDRVVRPGCVEHGLDRQESSTLAGETSR
jgi:hypothetical protein